MPKQTHFWPDLGLLGPNADCQFFFSKIWLCQSMKFARKMIMALSEKTNDLILRKFSDGHIDR